jgi:hypothetical protein
MACANKCHKKAEQIQMPSAVYGLASKLIGTCYDLVAAGVSALPTNFSSADLLIVLQSLIRENQDLQEKVNKKTGPRATADGPAVQLTFGPDNAYTFNIPVPCGECDAFADQLADVAQKLRRRATAKKMVCAAQQMLPFSDCA